MHNTLTDLLRLNGEWRMQSLRSFPVTCLLITIVSLALSGCKLEIRVPHGGTVVSSDGAYICEAGQTCVIDVVDLFFDETFIAEPAHGFSFSHWEEKDRYLCGEQTTPCRLSTAEFEGKPSLLSILESDETFFLKPRFSLILGSCPEPKLIISPGPSPN
jgi:hypothetical protein